MRRASPAAVRQGQSPPRRPRCPRRTTGASLELLDVLGAEGAVPDLHLRLRLGADLNAGDRVRLALIADQLLRRAGRAAVDDLARGADAIADRRGRGATAAPTRANSESDQRAAETGQPSRSSRSPACVPTPSSLS